MAAKNSLILGIDIGGSGIKGALVDVRKGELVSERHRIATPQPPMPQAVAEVVAALVKHFDYQGQIGCTFPGIVRQGVIYSAVNMDKSWLEVDAKALFKKATHSPVHVLNDADAAGVAEVTFGAGKGQRGVVFMLTFGTGIGSAVFNDGVLLPNTELGHLELKGREVEPWASAKVKEDEDLSWKKWAGRVNKYLTFLEFLFSPDLFIIGGGVSSRSEKFFPHLKTRAPVVAAKLFNEAGIVGAAYLASLLKG
jgi:polyphosphate glucokinase